jgi:hypothetical protein
MSVTTLDLCASAIESSLASMERNQIEAAMQNYFSC